ncbi:28690_t:CDS:1 [Gigaspora margarita]|uniref:28690_t:CDS:1 n=1 Tax=Gigaspora margarita TaxID=4874 RepID=A0ABN7VQI3_GIGMA|nr:28690_t:CDS:1 [Gigaspora margarita]
MFENSTDNGRSSNSPPYLLTLEVEELISPIKHSRRAKNISSSLRPRPLNKYLLFRRDFCAKMKRQGMNMSAAKLSMLVSEEWNKQPVRVLRYFEILENLAMDRLNEIYPA